MLETTICVALVIGLTAVAKRIGMGSRFAPLLAVVLGIGLNVIAKFAGPDVASIIVGGIAVGLASCGLYDFGKKTILDQ